MTDACDHDDREPAGDMASSAGGPRALLGMAPPRPHDVRSGEAGPALGGLTRGNAALAPARASEPPRRTTLSPPRASGTQPRATFTRASASVAAAQASEAPPRASVMPPRPSWAQIHAGFGAASVSHADAPASLAGTPASLSQPPAGEDRAQASLARSSDSEARRAAPLAEPPAAELRPSGPVTLPPPAAGAKRLGRGVVHSYLAQPEARRVVSNVVRAAVPPTHVDDIVKAALLVAADVAHDTAPVHPAALPAWLTDIAQDVVTDYWAQRAPPPPPDSSAAATIAAGAHDPWFGRGDEPSTDGEDWLLGRWIVRQVAANSRDRETLAMLVEHTRYRKAYSRIAEERGLLQAPLAIRIVEFKRRYRARYAQQRDRMVFWVVVGGVAAVAATVIVWSLAQRPAHARVGEPHATTASAPHKS
jgi:hypothetical protein